jgi:hypothetical protein
MFPCNPSEYVVFESVYDMIKKASAIIKIMLKQLDSAIEIKAWLIFYMYPIPPIRLFCFHY